MVRLTSPKPSVKPSRRINTGALGLSSNPFPRNTFDCAHCGRQMNNYAGGYSRGFNNEMLCHPNENNRPDCYKLVTQYKHPTPCSSQTCYENHAALMTYVNAYGVDTFSKELENGWGDSNVAQSWSSK